MGDLTEHVGRFDPELDDVVTELRDAGLDVAFAYVPTEEEAKAAGERLAAQDQALVDLTGKLPPALIEFDPRHSKWEDTADPLWLLTPDEFGMVPAGSTLVCISGETAVKGRDEIDQDTRGGCMAWGFLDSQLPPR